MNEVEYPCPEGSTACNTSSNYKVLPRYNFGVDKKNTVVQTNSIFGYLQLKGKLPSGGSVYYKSFNNDSEAGYYKKYDNEDDNKLSIVVYKLVSNDGKCALDKIASITK